MLVVSNIHIIYLIMDNISSLYSKKKRKNTCTSVLTPCHHYVLQLGDMEPLLLLLGATMVVLDVCLIYKKRTLQLW